MQTSRDRLLSVVFLARKQRLAGDDKLVPISCLTLAHKPADLSRLFRGSCVSSPAGCHRGQCVIPPPKTLIRTVAGISRCTRVVPAPIARNKRSRFSEKGENWYGLRQMRKRQGKKISLKARHHIQLSSFFLFDGASLCISAIALLPLAPSEPFFVKGEAMTTVQQEPPSCVRARVHAVSRRALLRL